MADFIETATEAGIGGAIHYLLFFLLFTGTEVGGGAESACEGAAFVRAHGADLRSARHLGVDLCYSRLQVPGTKEQC